jgi:hypothetical protein
MEMERSVRTSAKMAASAISTPKQPYFRGFFHGSMPPKSGIFPWVSPRNYANRNGKISVFFSSRKYATRNSHISVVFSTEVCHLK